MTALLQSYLFAWLFFLSIALGSLALLAIHGLTGGRWGDAIRAPLLAAIGTLPILAILFIPIAIGMNLLFRSSTHPVYLGVPFFIARALIYFACWVALAIVTVRRRSVPYPGPMLLLYVVTMTFASWDWMMSLEPKWWSTMYAMDVVTGQSVTALAAIILFVTYFRIGREVWPDLGNLLLAALMFWAYLEFSQFLIIWFGNGKEEIAWYLSRTQTSWRWIAVLLVVFAFFGPFLALLFRSAKRSASVLATIAGVTLFTQLLKLFWTIAPAFRPRGFLIGWFDVPALVVLGAILFFTAKGTKGFFVLPSSPLR
jgi:hypothetical protein